MMRVFGRQIAGKAFRFAEPATGRPAELNCVITLGLGGNPKILVGLLEVAVDYFGLISGRTFAASRNRTRSGWIEVIRVRVSNLYLVVIQPIAATEDDVALRPKRTPVEADLWSKVQLLRVPGTNSSAYTNPSQQA